MLKERIIKFGPLVYAKLLDDNGKPYLKKVFCFADGEVHYECNQIFWRFFIAKKENYGC